MASVLGSSLLNLAATSVSLAAGFLVSVINARLLGPAGSGAVAYALWLVICAAAIADLGLPQTVLRYVAALEGAREAAWKPMVRRAFSLFLRGVALVFLLFLANVAFHWEAGAVPWLWIAAAVLFLAYALSAFSVAAARGRGLFRETAETTVVGSLLQVPVVFLGALLLGPAGALFGMLVRYLPQAFCLFRHVDRAVPGDPAALTPEMRRYGRSMWTSDVIDVVLATRIEYVVVGYFLADAEIGYFAAAVVFAGLVGQLTVQLSPAFLVGLASRRTEAETPEAEGELYRNTTRLAALLIMPLGIGGAAIVPPLVPLVFGEAFSPAAGAAALFMLAAVPAGLSVVPWAYLAAHEHGRDVMRLTLVSALLTLVALVAVVPVAGVLGAAVVRLVSEIFAFGLFVRSVRVHGGPPLPWGVLARTLAAALPCGACAFLLSWAMPGVGGILLAILAGALVFVLAVRTLGLIGVDEAGRLAEIVEERLPGGLRPLARHLAGLVCAAPARSG
ncbi:lipopolysaccharide biosynthesis protein [Shinella pollutisoli]|uniref:Lipopolysaccharide biosynthesis protein n=1 Tax=Shinella pollutisoli TaxID=2250594 RepID=A0ABV7DPU2_9HYPH|nr:lipopolysaccharide biosynthesis protein [Shinella pollutisoli]